MTLHIQTPLIESRPLSLAASRTVWLKLDALQPCGSFKLRGVGHACEVHHARGARHFVSSSGGNAGLAVAYAGRKLGVPVTVVVPETTTERAKELLHQEDAKVVVHGSSWQEANALAQTLVGPHDAFIHPFDDPLLWAGHASLIDEVAATGYKPDAVVLSVGGGGLLSGVVEGLKRNGWDDVPVVAVETEGAASLHAAVQAGHPVELERLASVATSLGAKRVADQAMACVHEHPVHSVLVSDRAALQACERFLADHRVLVEPACGAALAVTYEAGKLDGYSNVLVVVCGGATATLEQIQAWLKQVD
ncbi:pyridoxal-phosphate dependent enzyme [Pseudomonas putida]|uniref:pyridoxal-phosphate dependent enzyme n=1 Tax=Pseudomonas putida TaxID=303 RepID=UPI0018E69756|nr:pyridoxal-phosphate dependent enzyme [Pseudomonas putida]MBI6942639.1 pyridoxal-phosphate dependent enzyme [Pseudomonas putida]MBI6958775.1 pyridoxal-phosphate dependent enzyme [Pseudomonas putida]